MGLAVLLINNKKRCSKCKRLLPAQSFSKCANAVCLYRSECKACIKKLSKDYYAKTKDKQRDYQRLRCTKNKVKVLTFYGNSKLACVRCGFTDIRALTIDHINGGGGQHRKQLHKSLYKWLIDNSFPKGYQTLCMNCQYIKRMENEECLKK